MDENSEDRTAILTPNGHFDLRSYSQDYVGPFLLSHIGWMKRQVTQIQNYHRYDVQIYSYTFTEHLKRLGEVLKRFCKANLKLKPSKCSYAQNSSSFLGYVVEQYGIHPNPVKVKGILDIPRRNCLKAVQSLIRARAHYHNFILEFLRVAFLRTNFPINFNRGFLDRLVKMLSSPSEKL